MVRKVRYKGPRGGLVPLSEYREFPEEKKKRYHQFSWYEDE